MIQPQIHARGKGTYVYKKSEGGHGECQTQGSRSHMHAQTCAHARIASTEKGAPQALVKESYSCTRSYNLEGGRRGGGSKEEEESAGGGEGRSVGAGQRRRHVLRSAKQPHRKREGNTNNQHNRSTTKPTKKKKRGNPPRGWGRGEGRGATYSWTEGASIPQVRPLLSVPSSR